MLQEDASDGGRISGDLSPPLRRAWVARSERYAAGGGDTNRPVVADGVVYANSGSGVMAVRATDGRRLWFVAPEEGSRGVTPALDELALYVPVGAGRVISLNRGDGAQRWKFQAEGDLDSSPVALGGRLYFGSAEARTFYCLGALDGAVIWKVRTELEPDSIPAAGKGVVVVPTQDPDSSRAMLLAFDATTGKERWRFLHRLGASSPSIAVALDAVVFGGGDLRAHALRLEDGRPLWRSRVEGSFGIWSVPGVAFDDVFLADRGGNVYRLDGATGRRRWVFRGARGTMDRSSPVVAGGSVMIGSGAGELFALDVSSGRLQWAGSVDGSVLSGAADSERFYIGVASGDAGVHAYEHDASGHPSPAARGSEGSLRGLTGMVVSLAVAGVLFFRLLRRRGNQPRSSPTSIRRSSKATGATRSPVPSSRTSPYPSGEGKR